MTLRYFSANPILKTLAIAVALAALLGAGACGDDSAGLPAGTEGGPCRADGSCDTDLV